MREMNRAYYQRIGTLWMIDGINTWSASILMLVRLVLSSDARRTSAACLISTSATLVCQISQCQCEIASEIVRARGHAYEVTFIAVSASDKLSRKAVKRFWIGWALVRLTLSTVTTRSCTRPVAPPQKSILLSDSNRATTCASIDMIKSKVCSRSMPQLILNQIAT